MRKYEMWNEPEQLKKIEQWASEGCTQEDIAQQIGIARKTFAQWLNKSTEIAKAYKQGILNPLAKVRDNLLGLCEPHQETQNIYRYDKEGNAVLVETRVKEVPPSERAIMFYLTNRDAQNWNNSSKIEVEGAKLLLEGADGLDV